MSLHLFCYRRACSQELRELALRGVDGPGMHILDVLPNSFPTAPGALAARSPVAGGSAAITVLGCLSSALGGSPNL